jgi:hypothetical protein
LNYVTAPPACYLEALRSNKHDMQPKFSLDSKGIQPGMAAQPMRTCSLRPAAHWRLLKRISYVTGTSSLLPGSFAQLQAQHAA